MCLYAFCFTRAAPAKRRKINGPFGIAPATCSRARRRSILLPSTIFRPSLPPRWFRSWRAILNYIWKYYCFSGSSIGTSFVRLYIHTESRVLTLEINPRNYGIDPRFGSSPAKRKPTRKNVRSSTNNRIIEKRKNETKLANITDRVRLPASAFGCVRISCVYKVTSENIMYLVWRLNERPRRKIPEEPRAMSISQLFVKRLNELWTATENGKTASCKINKLRSAAENANRRIAVYELFAFNDGKTFLSSFRLFSQYHVFGAYSPTKIITCFETMITAQSVKHKMFFFLKKTM